MLEVNVDGDKATAKLQTPTKVLSSAKIAVEKKSDGEYELKTERNASPELNMQAQLSLKPNNRRIRVQVYCSFDCTIELMYIFR